MSSESNEASHGETNGEAGGDNQPIEQTVATRGARQPRVPRRAKNNETQDDELKAQIRATAAASQAANRDEQFTELSVLQDDGSRVGDNVDPDSLRSVSVNPSRIRSESTTLRSGQGSERSMRDPSVRSIYSGTRTTSVSTVKEGPSEIPNGQQVGAVAVQERAYGHLPAWHRNQTPTRQTGQDQSNIPPEMRIDQSSEMLVVEDQSNIPPEMRLVQDQSHIPPEMRSVDFSVGLSVDLDDPEDTPEQENGAAYTDESKEGTAIKWKCIYLALGLLVIGAIGGVVVGTTSGKKDDQSQMPPSSLVIPECSDFADIDPNIENMAEETLDRYNDLLENFVQRLLSDYSFPSIADEYCSSLHRALVWLANDQISSQSTKVAENRFLLAFHFIAWKGEMWLQSKSTKWLTDTSECDWHGVSCDDAGVIFELSLQELQNSTDLGVHIPSEIGLLTDLRSLKLNKNEFNGELPSTLGDLTNLEVLDLSDNRELTGTFPYESISRLQGLRTLSLSDIPRLKVSIPSSINQLTALEYLSIARGSQEFEPLPSEIGDLSNLVVLNLRQSTIRGTIPTEIGKLRNLEYIDLGSNNFDNELITEIGLLENLKSLVVDDNSLDGFLPTEIGSLLKLENLALDRNFFIGALPSEIGNCTLLKNLTLSETDIDMDVPIELGQLSNLQTLDLSQLDFLGGSIPSQVFTFRNLEFIDLAETKFVGSISANLTELQSLRCIEVTDTDTLTGAVVGENGCSLDFSNLDECGTRKMVREDCSCCPPEGVDDCDGIEFSGCVEIENAYEDSITPLKDQYAQL